LSKDYSHQYLKSLIEINSPNLSLGRQAELLGISRSGLYYQPRPVNPLTLNIMNRIDEINTKFPYFGSRKITAKLNRHFKKENLGLKVNRKRIQRLMRIMGIEAIYPKKYTSIPDKQHQVYPYLLRGLTINKPNQVWGIDITYIRLINGWIYLTAVLDWFTRFVVGWETSISLDRQMVINAIEKAFQINIPDIMNSDQGSQMTSVDYINLLESKGIKISMDGRGRCFDNIFTERLWRNVKYEEVYLKEYQNPKDARENLDKYFKLYNYERPHQNLDYQVPADLYFKN
jgi:putative transposase